MGKARAHDGAKAAGGAGDEQSLHESVLFHKAGVLDAQFPDNAATKRQAPTGGVHRPMPRFIIMITPNWMRLAMDFHSALRAGERAESEAMLKAFFLNIRYRRNG
jgi:hypothetical protein